MELQSKRAVTQLFRAVYFYFASNGTINWMLGLIRVVEDDSHIAVLHVLKVALQSG